MKRQIGNGVRLHGQVWWALAVALLLAPGLCLAEEQKPLNLVKNGDAETGKPDNWPDFSGVVSQGAHSGKFCFQQKAGAGILSAELIPIEAGKKYVLSGWFKSDGKTPSVVYLGFAPYDANKIAIHSSQVTPVAETETTLFAPCAKEDTVLKVVNGAKWTADDAVCAAFDVDDSGNYADLPNRKLTPLGILKAEKKGDFWEIQLKNKCGQQWLAGTKVREQVSQGPFMYSAALNAVVPKDWQQYSGTISGVAKSGGTPGKLWWPGTRYVKIILLANYGQNEDAVLLADDISLTGSDK